MKGRFSKAEDEEKPKPKKEPGLFDFLTQEEPKKKQKQETKLLQSGGDSSEEELSFKKGSQPRQRRYKKDYIEPEKPVGRKKSQPDLWGSRNADEQIPVDQSSICADIEMDPNMRLRDPRPTVKQ